MLEIRKCNKELKLDSEYVPGVKGAKGDFEKVRCIVVSKISWAS